LLGTDLDMAAIAEKVGYRHQSTFAAAFKREVGMPPSSWRMAQIQMKRFASM
jgi:AraC-like DNA-binding protein